MKKTTKIVMSSAMTMALCASLIAGSTLALFSSESRVNIAVTSGKVDVSATVGDLQGFSAVWDETANNYISEEVNVPGEFNLGGRYSYEEATNELSLENIAPGDAVTFTVNTTNNSTLEIKYRTRVQVKEGTDSALFPYLQISVSGVEIGGSRAAASPWKTTSGAIDPIEVKIELPIGAEECMNMACDLQIIVEAVQGNAHTVDYVISTVEDLNSKLADAENGSTVELTEDLVVEEGSIEIEGEKQLTLDLAGNTLDIKDTGANGIVAMNGAEVTVTNSGNGGAYTYSTNKNDFHAVYVLNKQAGTTTSVTFEDVEVNTSNESGRQISVYIVGDAGKAMVNFNDGCVFNMDSKDEQFCGFYVEGDEDGKAEMNVNGGVINVGGEGSSDITGISLDTNHAEDGQAVLNFIGGEINVIGSGSILGIEIGTGGTVNMSCGTINVLGTGNPEAMGIGIHFYGTVNMSGGTIKVAAESGTACGLTGSPDTYFDETQVHLSGSATITVEETEDNRNVAIAEELLELINDENNPQYTDTRPNA